MLDDLLENDFTEDLLLGQAQNIAGFVLPLWDAFNTAAVNLGKIAGVIQTEGDQHSNDATGITDTVIHKEKPVHLAEDGLIEEQTRHIVNDEDLEHQRDTADDPDDHFRNGFDGL